MFRKTVKSGAKLPQALCGPAGSGKRTAYWRSPRSAQAQEEKGKAAAARRGGEGFPSEGAHGF
jgi:hypothetical protein